jgi:hypothetical protein
MTGPAEHIYDGQITLWTNQVLRKLLLKR